MLTSAPGGFNTAVMGFTTAIGHRRTFEFVFIPIKNGPNPKTNDTMNKLTKLTSGASVAAGDVVVFDGIIVDFAGANSDSWGSVNLNAGGYLGLTSANLGVLV